MSLTSKELMLLQDNIAMLQHRMKFGKSCENFVMDPAIKGLLQDLYKYQQDDMKTLIQHINQANAQ